MLDSSYFDERRVNAWTRRDIYRSILLVEAGVTLDRCHLLVLKSPIKGLGSYPASEPTTDVGLGVGRILL